MYRVWATRASVCTSVSTEPYADTGIRIYIYIYIQIEGERDTTRGECYWHFANCDRLPPPWVASVLYYPPTNLPAINGVDIRGRRSRRFLLLNTQIRIEKPTEWGGAGPGGDNSTCYRSLKV